MTSKERVQAALNHQIPDRVPINYLANPGIDTALKQSFKLGAQDTDLLLEKLQVDIREVALPYLGPPLHAPRPGRSVDEQWGIIKRWVEHETGGYWDYCDFPLHILDEEKAESWPMPEPDDFAYSAILDQVDRYKEKALFLGNPGLADILNTTGMLCGMETVYMALALQDPNWLHLVDRRLDIQLEITRRALETAGGSIDCLWIGEDLGSQNGPLISTTHYRSVIRPRHQKFVDLASSFNIPVMIHSCGSSSWAFQDFIEMGIAAVDTLQPEAAHMKPEFLKGTYGKDLAFHGGFSTAGSVVEGTREEVIADLEGLLATMMPESGYLFSPTHMFQDNTSLENLITVYSLLPELGRY